MVISVVSSIGWLLAVGEISGALGRMGAAPFHCIEDSLLATRWAHASDNMLIMQENSLLVLVGNQIARACGAQASYGWGREKLRRNSVGMCLRYEERMRKKQNGRRDLRRAARCIFVK